MVCDNCHDGIFPVGSIYVLDGEGSKRCVQCGTVTTRTFDFSKKVPPAGSSYTLQGFDPVNHPEHYKTGGIETIDFLEAKLGEGFEDYCVGNILKYLTRYKHKNGLEDLKKARWYLEKVITWKSHRMDGNNND